MKLKLYQVDAFTDKVFSGNPAAVCPLDSWLKDDLLQKIGMENNLAETAFYVKNGDAYEIRWFTPTIEVDLCGHATLASAYVLFNYQNYPGNTIKFHSRRSGVLSVDREADLLKLNFPTDVFNRVDLSSELKACFDKTPVEAYRGKTDFMLVFESERDIRDVKPTLDQISILPARGLIVTAPGDNVVHWLGSFIPCFQSTPHLVAIRRDLALSLDLQLDAHGPGLWPSGWILVAK
jgi:predicted PhzF superfamily epimerase YddE/YHI9